ncbi:MAG: antitoxin Xre/MbcA/ParS toxin-binding domain-containing protein [Pseudomonadota bacterium]|nr:antitoxin Xre/MbcA/ParS toxin-binding domain-containing protein [Pseudomonadota bacterium]
MKKYVPGQAKRPGRTDVFRRLGLPSRGEPLTRAVQEGFPVVVLERLADELDAPQKVVLLAVGIAPATLKRRRASGRLSLPESDRVFRLASIFQKAMQLFEGDGALAREWLEQPQKALGGRTPMEYLDTEAGANEVEDLIGRLEYGVIAWPCRRSSESSRRSTPIPPWKDWVRNATGGAGTAKAPP